MTAMSGSYTLLALSGRILRASINTLVLTRSLSFMNRNQYALCRKSTIVGKQVSSNCCQRCLPFPDYVGSLCVPNNTVRQYFPPNRDNPQTAMDKGNWLLPSNPLRNNTDLIGIFSNINLLMPHTFPAYVFPTKQKFRNAVLSYLAVKRITTMDEDLITRKEEFLESSQQAVFVIANLLSTGKIGDLQGLCTREAYRQIKENYVKLRQPHRRALAIDVNEVEEPTRRICRVVIKRPTSLDASHVMQIMLTVEGIKKRKQDGKIDSSPKYTTDCTIRLERKYRKVGKSFESHDPWKVSGISFSVLKILAGELTYYFI